MTITVPKLKGYMKAGLNVLITGPAGTGKTAMLKTAADELGLAMKYYNTATLDPFVDFLGIPVPDTANKLVEYYRPKAIDEAEVIFFDELNRAPAQTLNAVFEVVQFRSVNGTPLPKLKCVVAAINPVSDEYTTEELDLALMDRWDLYLDAEVKADYAYFKDRFGTDFARAGITLFDEYQRDYTNSLRGNSKTQKLGYFSPRRLEKLMDIFLQFPEAATVKAVLPGDVNLGAKVVTERFKNALTPKTNSSSAVPSVSAPLAAPPTGTLAGKSFAISGAVPKPFRNRADWVRYVEKNGGTFHSDPRSNTDFIVANSAEVSTKVNKAKRLGTPFLTPEEFRERYMDAVAGNAAPASPTAPSGPEAIAKAQLAAPLADVRKRANAKPFIAAYQAVKPVNPVLADQLRTHLANALNYGVGPDTVDKVWKAVVREFTPTEKKLLIKGWSPGKTVDMNHFINRW